MVKRKTDRVCQNKETGLSFTAGVVTTEVTVNLWLIDSIRKHFTGMAKSIDTSIADSVSTWPPPLDMC